MKKIFFVFAMLCSSVLLAQNVYHFTNGLASGKVHQYGREAMYSDTLAYSIYKGESKPQEGLAVSTEAKTKWTAIKADSANNFRSQALANGYLYLTYNAPKAVTAVFIGTGHSMVFINGAPHAGDMYRYGWMYIPVQLKKGINEFYIRAAGAGRFASVKAMLDFSFKPVQLSAKDATLPFFIEGETVSKKWAGLVVVNSSKNNTAGMSITAAVEDQKIQTNISNIAQHIARKVAVEIPVPKNVSKGSYRVALTLMSNNQIIDTTSIVVTAVKNNEHASHTFISGIDGSVQYYAVAPQANDNKINPSLFLSVHGAEVEAISQARAYKPKSEGPIVAPTNRRPRGFNWEDWGRLDALEVFEIAKKIYQPNPQHIYLTGHSMGGHGTWYLGATYPGKWAAIAPSAGYPTLAAYGSHDGLVPNDTSTPVKKILTRASTPSNVLGMVNNYKANGVYIFHGDADETVSVNYARQMKKVLAEFHPDFSYYEYPGGSHWFSDESVDWAPIFDYFKRHTIPVSSKVNVIDYTIPSTAISNTYHWLQVLQQTKSFEYSRVQITRNMKTKKITGTTTNINAVAIDTKDFAVGDTVSIVLDGSSITHIVNGSALLLEKNTTWNKGMSPSLTNKGIQRNGGLKEAFNHNMVFVYATHGTEAENNWALQKATYDAETWYYRGNGSVSLIADKDFTTAAYQNQGVILYGNETTNTAAAALLTNCPIKVTTGKIVMGSTVYEGQDLGAYFMYPAQNNGITSVALIGGTGVQGMQAADANQYFSGGSGFPDFMIFSLDMLIKGENGIKAVGYFNNDWSLGKDFYINK
ncbi:MAG: prolyl oligopeptidase family serine peptidase [Sediminibacterium sp.]